MDNRPRPGALAGALALALCVCSCGGGGSADGDGGPPDGRVPDAGIDGGGTLTCETSATFERVPDQLAGDLDGADPDLDVSPGACAAVDAPFGIQALGPDEVVALRNLDPGVDYAVRLVSADDLAFYIGSDCAETADTIDGCLLFVDASTGNIEVGRFTAPAAQAVLVIDHWDAEAPTDGSYTLEVYPVECDDGDTSACAGSTPVCVDFRCASCDDDFDCNNPNLPVCDPVADRCVSGVDRCDSDDAGEPDDDGPAGARDLTPSGIGSTSLDGQICNAPLSEYDFYRFDVAGNGESYLIELEWSAAGVDLDMEVTDSEGRSFGLSLFERPETIALTYLPAGTYYVQVNYSAAGQITAPVDYTIRATRGPATPCNGEDDCAAEFRNQVFRSICSAGACQLRLGDGSLGEGAICDSDPDCASGVCASFPFTAAADTRSLCTTSCTSDSQCAALGPDWVCTTYLASDECVKKCTDDLECPVSLSYLPQSGPWFRLTCNVATGKCTF